ncbi:DUF551 domain-containing protein [Acinetobacter sp. CFCC 10889]|uniref:DUF551 domain-containing protein n=1 Tax=Acinetobacter sp. CFCC 10889 TaxID=1775557 RepID=UPI000DD06EC3|nr:DUF551 domain-containing protein [Acinetobacter sp. CFCC 10889]
MDIQKKPTLAEKQAFWAEQLPNFEANYWLSDRSEFLVFDMEQGNYVVKDDLDPIYEDDANDTFHRVNTGWAMWKKAIVFCHDAQKVAVPEWISITERMPNEGDEVLVHHYGHVVQATKDKKYSGGFKQRNCYGWEAVSSYISHWMPKNIELPESFHFYYENDAKQKAIEAQEQNNA